jgi:hypothetical protein
MFVLHIIAMSMEIGILVVTMCSLLSELQHPHLSVSQNGPAYQKKRKEVVATSVSLVASIIAFGITILGAGDFLRGVKIVGKRISAAGRAVLGIPVEADRSVSGRQISSRNCCLKVEDTQVGSERGRECSVSQDGDRQSCSEMHGKAQ